MKKIYCKYCGCELENGSCSCEQFLAPENKKVKENKVCDTCNEKIDNDAIFCPYCGIPVNVNGNIKELQKELRGEKALDVLEVYENANAKNGVKKRKIRKSPNVAIFSSILIMLMLVITFVTFILPIVKQKMLDYQMKKEFETAHIYEEMPSDENVKIETEETSQQVIELKDKWIRSDGYFYAFDENGDPVVDDWVTEIDENGNEQKYYFDIDGKLVVNSWIDGEYYVGADGAMLRDQDTPDGAHVDEDGRVLLQEGEGVDVVRETYVYYENPNSSETKSAVNQKSSTSGEIKGVKPDKKYELYVKSLRQERNSVQKGDLKCNIIYYVPIIAGADEREVKNINAALEESFDRFARALNQMVNETSNIPKSVIFNTIEQRTLNSNRMNIIVHGRITPRKGLTEKRKFRFIYDRKSKKVTIADISE